MVRLVISLVYCESYLVSEYSKASHLMIYSVGKTAEVMELTHRLTSLVPSP